jgi:hypothetical protein
MREQDNILKKSKVIFGLQDATRFRQAIMALKKGAYTSPSGEKQTGVDIASTMHAGARQHIKTIKGNLRSPRRDALSAGNNGVKKGELYIPKRRETDWS